ncbi:hypothetical protein DdX_03694 [Ditylenchus destructor]|uniref:Uncharacterized protein n=1 Tax=Ditylenchus destructor TaxID=166010 RepID=A0AAD4R520_9BILA|nr:hypothetical protein DdX_03694 [Ditylenchus destructor]
MATTLHTTIIQLSELLKRRFGNQKVIGEILQQELISLPKATNATQSLRNSQIPSNASVVKCDLYKYRMNIRLSHRS